MIKIVASQNGRWNSCSIFDLDNLVELEFQNRGTGDVYILGRTYENGNMDESTSKFTFIVMKDQPELYKIFNKVYIGYVDLMKKNSFDCEQGLQYDKLNQQIIISSEDRPISTCNEFIIRKLSDGYEINIINKDNEERYTQVCFVGSGSRLPEASLFGTFFSLLHIFSEMANPKEDEYECRNQLEEKGKIKRKQIQ